ncbi:cytochrome b5-like heme/steroid binding domain-containing protein [Polychytrium aggregatum]|uniref:cytochrome b5-like heme/steroid binding domain-containing protein n=1 Tax=Polychytrium aggregatum TaxID=110093 RepID=UPI0022FE6D10|nr:cytochrome b5-like heme/steroid binding domain-containing protein [Polychytrium aggregatum]KAI9204656.1 cytochrome b5-like heme/steroid binding domain-containing protein [Polychytrium aggregatum]
MSVKIFEWSEVEKHNTRDDCWMVIDGKVYDCSKFLDEHPGGEEVLLEVAGQDATDAFEEIGHSDDARELLKTLYIGDLNPASAKTKSSKASAATPASHGGDAAAKAAGNNSLLFALVPIVVVVAYLAYQFINQK